MKSRQDRDGYRLVIIICSIVIVAALVAAVGAFTSEELTSAQRLSVPLGMLLPLVLAPFFIYKALQGLKKLEDEE